MNAAVSWGAKHVSDILESTIGALQERGGVMKRWGLGIALSLMATPIYANEIKLMPNPPVSEIEQCRSLAKEFNEKIIELDNLAAAQNTEMKIYIELLKGEAANSVLEEQDYKIKSIAKKILTIAIMQSDNVDNLRSHVCIASDVHYDWSNYLKKAKEVSMRQLK